jgi:epoxide hydrolase-like predicted phosphatase
MGAVRNVIFDLGGVLLDWNPDKIASRFESEPELRERLKQTLFGHADWQLFDRGTFTEAELIERVRARTGRNTAEISAIIDAVRESLDEKPDTVKLLRALHQRGTELFCLSNMPMSIYDHLRRRHVFWDAFRGIVISGEVRMMKPEPEVFAHLLEKYELRPDETVFVDDLSANVDAAKRVGLHGILFKDAAQCRSELDPLLDRP